MSELEIPPSIVGRLAPSPTGHLHLGHARSFLIAWWHARKRGGQVRLRLEDLDQERSQQQFIDDALFDLTWLGLDWDGPVVRQSEQLDRIRAQAFRLQDQGIAYACICSRSDIQALSAPHGADGTPLYPRTCRDRFESLYQAEQQTGRLAGLRFRVAHEPVGFADELCGWYDEKLALTCGDFLLLRRDKIPAYQLAVVVDDAAQGVTEVVRGDDLLPSTPRQIAIHHALGLELPTYAHLPLVLDAQGKRLAKRHASLSLKTLRESGVDPRALVQFILQSCGVRECGRVSATQATALFDLSQLPRTPVSIDETSIIAQLEA